MWLKLEYQSAKIYLKQENVDLIWWTGKNKGKGADRRWRKRG